MEYTFTISKDDYDNLKKAEYILDDMNDEIESIIKNASMSYYGNKLEFDDNEIQRFFKKYFARSYKSRIDELKKEKEKKDNE